MATRIPAQHTRPEAIPVRFAKVGTVLHAPAGPVPVRMGSHWPAEDPLVVQHPEVFADDPRYGLQFTGEPPAYMLVAPDAPLPTSQ